MKIIFQIDGAESPGLFHSAFTSHLDDANYSQTGRLPFGAIDRHVRDQTVTLNYANTLSGNAHLGPDVTAFWSNTSFEQENASGPAFSSLFVGMDSGYEACGLRVENTSTLDL